MPSGDTENIARLAELVFKRDLQYLPLEDRRAGEPQLRLCEEGNIHALEED